MVVGIMNRTRIDARPQNSPATQAGMRGVHRGMRGEVIGGYTAEGEALGTKAGRPSWRTPVVPGGAAPAPVAANVAQPTAPVPARTANPNATPLGKRRSWRDGGVPGSIGREIGESPNRLGGGLARWKAMNPDAGKFGQKAAKPAAAAAPTASSNFVAAAMPKPAVPSPVPVKPPVKPMADTTASKARAVGGWKKPPRMS